MAKWSGLTAAAFLVILCSLTAGCSLHPDTFQLQTAPAPKARVYPYRVAVVTDKKLAPYKIYFRYWSTTPFAYSLGGLPDAYAETLMPYFRSVESLEPTRAPSTASHDLIARMSIEKFHFDGANVNNGRDKVNVTVRFTIQQADGREVFGTLASGSASGVSLTGCMACLPTPEPHIRKAFAEAFAQLGSQLTTANLQVDGEAGGEPDDADAQNRLGVAYHYGEGVVKDVPRALELYRKAAGQGLVQAQLNLARTYNFGIGVKRDYVEAAIWYGKAARQGDAGAQADLGVAYANGEGVARDEREAARWFYKASQQGHAVSTFRLASMYWGYDFGLKYATGNSEDSSLSLFEKSAAQGYAPAAFRLAEIHSSGSDDKPVDSQQACQWAMVARLLDEPGEWQDRQPEQTSEVHRALPKLLAGIRGQLTADQINTCEGRAREWVTANVK